MSMIKNEDEGRCGLDKPASRWMLDPLDEDDDAQEVSLTRRQVVRIALVASEAGARFQRERSEVDPMAWMLAPRRMFAGRPPIEACADRDDCMRAVLTHGLGLGLDPAASAIDALIIGEELGKTPRNTAAFTEA